MLIKLEGNKDAANLTRLLSECVINIIPSLLQDNDVKTLAGDDSGRSLDFPIH